MPLQPTAALALALLLLLAAAATVPPAAGLGRRVGGWQPIKDVNDPYVQEIAAFAVSEHNKQSKGGTRLQLGGVKSGETQTVAGTNYRLIISATDGGKAAGDYEAVVWDRPWVPSRQLTSFKPVKR